MAPPSSSAIAQEEIVKAVDEVLVFAGIQGARTTLERLEDDMEGRRRLRVRVVREKRDWVYEVLIDKKGLMGIYRSA